MFWRTFHRHGLSTGSVPPDNLDSEPEPRSSRGLKPSLLGLVCPSTQTASLLPLYHEPSKVFNAPVPNVSNLNVPGDLENTAMQDHTRGDVSWTRHCFLPARPLKRLPAPSIASNATSSSVVGLDPISAAWVWIERYQRSINM
jgi:hypothetical protein